MPHIESFAQLLRTFAPVLIVTAMAILCIGFARWVLLRRNPTLRKEHRLPRQLFLFGLSVLGLIAIVLALPVPKETRNQLLTLLGLLASAVVGLSSTTLVANAMAGLMLRTTKSFRIGDFIRVEEQFGRVTERRLLYTEIQTEDRDLTTLPNSYLISNPVTVVRSSGTIVSATLSLGYDVHHGKVEPLLLEAGRRAELEEPFVRILELGNFSVTYRVSGFLRDIKNLLTARSNLCKVVLEVLHSNGVEIVSPSFMNQRPLPPDLRMIPTAIMEAVPKEGQRMPEDLMFDKAERAERIEYHLFRLRSEIKKLEGRLEETEGEERSRVESDIERRRKQVAALENAPEKAGAKAKE